MFYDRAPPQQTACLHFIDVTLNEICAKFLWGKTVVLMMQAADLGVHVHDCWEGLDTTEPAGMLECMIDASSISAFLYQDTISQMKAMVDELQRKFKGLEATAAARKVTADTSPLLPVNLSEGVIRVNGNQLNIACFGRSFTDSSWFLLSLGRYSLLFVRSRERERDAWAQVCVVLRVLSCVVLCCTVVIPCVIRSCRLFLFAHQIPVSHHI